MHCWLLEVFCGILERHCRVTESCLDVYFAPIPGTALLQTDLTIWMNAGNTATILRQIVHGRTEISL